MTTDLLDFPTIEAPPPVVAAPVPAPIATPPATPVAVVAPSIKATVLAQFKEAEAGMLALAEKYRAVVFDVKTTKGMNEAKAARLDLRENGRLALTRAETRVKADVNSLKSVMSDEVDRLVAIVKPAEDAIDAQIKAEEKRKADEKAERERIEAERVAKHRERLAKIPAYLTHCQQPGMTAARIAAGIELLAKTTFGPDWQEFAVPAANAQCETLEAMRKLHAQAVEREAETVRLEAQRAEQERIAEQQAEAQRQLAAQAATLAANVARVTGLQARIAEIHAAATGHEHSTPAMLREAAIAVASLDVSEAEYQEFAAQAQGAKDMTIAMLDRLHAAAMQRQAEATAAAEAAALAATRATVGPAPVETIPVAEAIEADPETLVIIANPPFSAADLRMDVEAPVLVGDVGDDTAPLDPATQAVELEAELEQCRAALTQALALLDELICKPPTKKDAARLFARVSELRDMGHLPRAVLTTSPT